MKCCFFHIHWLSFPFFVSMFVLHFPFSFSRYFSFSPFLCFTLFFIFFFPFFYFCLVSLSPFLSLFVCFFLSLCPPSFVFYILSAVYRDLQHRLLADRPVQVAMSPRHYERNSEQVSQGPCLYHVVHCLKASLDYAFPFLM